VANSEFNGIAFDWSFGSPSDEVRDRARHYTGQVEIYSQADYDAMSALQQAATVRATGATTYYVDYWPPDPTHTLNMHLIDGATPETHQAILLSLRRGQKVAGDGSQRSTTADNTLHRCQADFLLRT
jgi:hypothetical protein